MRLAHTVRYSAKHWSASSAEQSARMKLIKPASRERPCQAHWQADAAIADRVDQARDAQARIALELKRIAKTANRMSPPDHIGAFQPGDRAHMYFASAW